MATGDFKVSISTISGGSVPNILKIFRGNKIERGYIPRALTSLAFSAMAEPFRLMEHLRFNGAVRDFKIQEPPVFILGHWRSGTTYLHNLMCQDTHFGFVTTYHGIFPELLGSEWLFKTFMNSAMPRKRASDNIALSPDYPQEEEFAMGNMNPYGFYNFWLFPKRTREYYERFVEFRGMSQQEMARWKADYIRLVKKALIYTKRNRFISKNPPHTGRLRQLLEMFPDARFIHIYRNPVTVFISTKKLVKATMPAIQFQDIGEQEAEENILWVYERMMKAYLRDRSLIPAGNLIEIRFEDFEVHPLPALQGIYQTLRLPGFNRAEAAFERYIRSQMSYEKNKYTISGREVEKITARWGFAMNEWKYDLPDNLEII